jgi:hypothetical protein
MMPHGRKNDSPKIEQIFGSSSDEYMNSWPFCQKMGCFEAFAM